MHGLFLGQGWAALCRTAARAMLPGAAQSPPCARGSGEVAGVGLGQDRRSAWHGEEGTCGTALHGGDGTARECQRTPGLMPPPARRGGGRQAALDASSSNLWLNLMGCSVGANNYTEMSSAARFARCPPPACARLPLRWSRLSFLPPRRLQPAPAEVLHHGQGQAARRVSLPSRPASAA